jgi:hypothetical protein
VPQQSKRSTARERTRRLRTSQTNRETASISAAGSRRAAARTCEWCGGSIEVKSRGRIPTWCSAACRQRAWEQARAAASGRSAIQVVERVVEVPVERVRAPRREEWPAMLRELATQLDTGRIYARDLPGLNEAIATVRTALNRHPGSRRLHRR